DVWKVSAFHASVNAFNNPIPATSEIFFTAIAVIGLLNALTEAWNAETFQTSPRLAMVAVKWLFKGRSRPSVKRKWSFNSPHETAQSPWIWRPRTFGSEVTLLTTG